MENQIWFAEGPIPNIDFEMISFNDFEEKTIEFGHKSFLGESQPLWRVRMTELDKENSTENENIYKIFFNFHHSITDGHSSFRIIGHFMNALNDVLMGSKVDDFNQFAVLTNCESEIMGKFMEIAMMLEKNPEEKERLIKSTENMKCECLTSKFYPQKDTTVVPQTLNLRHNFTMEQTKQLLSLCKKKGVTFHTFFSSIAQTALFEMFKDAGLKESKTKMSTGHVVNMRRWFKTDSESLEKFGTCFIPYSTTITLDSELDFWNQCLAFHNDFQSGLKNEVPLKHSVLQFSQGDAAKEHEKAMKEMREAPPARYYDTTNMGECTQILTGNFARPDHLQEDDKKAVLTDFFRTTSNHVLGVTWAHVLQTFKGRFLYGLDYNTNHVTKETANLYVTKIVHLVEDLLSSKR